MNWEATAGAIANIVSSFPNSHAQPGGVPGDIFTDESLGVSERRIFRREDESDSKLDGFSSVHGSCRC